MVAVLSDPDEEIDDADDDPGDEIDDAACELVVSAGPAWRVTKPRIVLDASSGLEMCHWTLSVSVVLSVRVNCS